MNEFIVKEYAVKDKQGNFKIWQKGRLRDYHEWLTEQASLAAAENSDSRAMLDTGMEEPRLAPPPPVIIAPTPAIKKFSLDKIVDKLNAKYQWQWDNEDLATFKKLLFSYFRDVREASDLRQLLERKLAGSGGVLANTDLDDLLHNIKKINAQIKAAKGQVISLDNESKRLQSEPSVQAKIAQAQAEARQQIAQDMNRGRAPIEQAAKQTNEPEFVVPDKPVKDHGWHLFKKREATVPAGKVAMQEVASFSKLVGPVDELRQLSLSVWRRLGPDSTTIINKIKQRIESLGADSLAKRLAAIKAWQASAVYKEYVDLGRASLEEGLPVDTIIQRRQSAGQETLTVQEFSAISDLNGQLRF
ncbi:MAG: hypothetical protein ACKKL5_00645 [Candidatus Komeilibacteria bacterium]